MVLCLFVSKVFVGLEFKKIYTSCKEFCLAYAPLLERYQMKKFQVFHNIIISIKINHILNEIIGGGLFLKSYCI